MVYTRTGPKQSGRRGQYVGHHWYDDIEVLPDEERVMPVTIPHDVVREHPVGCRCLACETYPDELKARLKVRSGRRRRR